jgi:hypothetical protein
MLVLHPSRVVFDGEEWRDVLALVVAREATRLVREWSDDGPHPTFVDVAEFETRLRVVTEVGSGQIEAPRVGEFATVAWQASQSGADSGRVACQLDGVVTSVTYQASKGRWRRVVEVLGQSPTGQADPLTRKGQGVLPEVTL